MANFVISRARRLFSYSDLGGSNGSTMDLEASPNSTVTEVKGIFKQRKKKTNDDKGDDIVAESTRKLYEND